MSVRRFLNIGLCLLNNKLTYFNGNIKLPLFIYLFNILKSYLKYTTDRDIADNADKNKKKQQKAHRVHVTRCSRDTYTKDNLMSFISSRVNQTTQEVLENYL